MNMSKIACYLELDDDVDGYMYVSPLISEYATIFMEIAMRTSEQSGYASMLEILQDHPIRCHEMSRKRKQDFHKLCLELIKCGLKDTIWIGVKETVAMFLYMVRHGVGNRVLKERFQHSGET